MHRLFPVFAPADLVDKAPESLHFDIILRNQSYKGLPLF